LIEIKKILPAALAAGKISESNLALAAWFKCLFFKLKTNLLYLSQYLWINECCFSHCLEKFGLKKLTD